MAKIEARIEAAALRAEAILGKARMNSFEAQDRLTKKVEGIYQNQRSQHWQKTGLQMVTLAASAVAGWWYKSDAWMNQISKAGEFFSAIAIDYRATDLNKEREVLQTMMSELNQLQGGMQQIIQTHETALQRLQQIESAGKV